MIGMKEWEKKGNKIKNPWKILARYGYRSERKGEISIYPLTYVAKEYDTAGCSENHKRLLWDCCSVYVSILLPCTVLRLSGSISQPTCIFFTGISGRCSYSRKKVEVQMLIFKAATIFLFFYFLTDMAIWSLARTFFKKFMFLFKVNDDHFEKRLGSVSVRKVE